MRKLRSTLWAIGTAAFAVGCETDSGEMVGQGGTATVDIGLDPAPRARVSGFVSDDGPAGWPLYAQLAFTPVGAPAVNVFTDPLTGFYSVRLPAGTDFTVTVEALVPGYIGEARPVTPGPADTIQNFALEVDTGTCTALGYRLTATPLSHEAFEGSFPPDGWTVESQTTGCRPPGLGAWTGDDIGRRRNLTGGTGGFAVADSDVCGPSVDMATSLTSPPFDLSALTDRQGLQIGVSQDLPTLPATTALIEVWDGAEWQPVATQSSDSRATRLTVGSKAGNGVSDARIRFTYTAGWDWWWQIDDLDLATTSCDYVGGGLQFGNISDRNTRAPINRATVETMDQPPSISFATPLDPALADGVYFVFLPGRQPISIAAPRYETRVLSVTPQVNGVIRRNFALAAGRVAPSPSELAIRVPYRGTGSATLTLVNDGTASATVDISELEGPTATLTIGPFAPSARRVAAKATDDPTASSVPPHATNLTRPLAAGDLVRIIPTGLPGPWGIGFDVPSQSGWVSNIGPLDGDDRLHQFLADGSSTGETAPSTTPVWGADLAYDSRHNTLWQVNVGGDDCIHEIDLGTRDFTGGVICPDFGTSERGLAYDPVTDTFYAGTWNDARVVQFDRNGRILRAVQTALSISGLAYNPATGHLFAAVNDLASAPLISVLDTANDLAQVGQFDIVQAGADLFDDFTGAGLELDCAGNLWAVNQVTRTIALAKSNERPGCRADVPWIDAQPHSVTIPPGGRVDVGIAVDGSILTPGLHEAQIVLLTSTPYDVPAVPLHVTAAFNDVPQGSFGDPEIHGLAGAGISFGCSPGNFCPADDMTRVIYPVWGLKSAFGPAYDSPHPTGLLFDDLGVETFGADFAEDAVVRGLMDGCGVRLFCPDAATTRREAAVFTLRLLFGADYVPPAAVGLFTDVDPADAPFVEDAVNLGFMAGCGPSTFCPADGLDRASGAILFVRAFGFRTFP